MRFGTAWPAANFKLIDKTTQIAPGIHLIALVSDKPGTLELRELSLAIETSHGMVIIVGCSHPGIKKIVAAAAAIDPRNTSLPAVSTWWRRATRKLQRLLRLCWIPSVWASWRQVTALASQPSRHSGRHSASGISMLAWERPY
ncbi:hypothetical protein [Povalibacter sp.]|uniref:hypothetical protein n=1 Tax=Povalibacter sp. TaxID=1962978 RepID=UPI002F415C2B